MFELSPAKTKIRKAAVAINIAPDDRVGADAALSAVEEHYSWHAGKENIAIAFLNLLLPTCRRHARLLD